MTNRKAKMTQSEFYSNIKSWLKERLSTIPKRPLVIGVSAPQGAGKTTLTSAMVDELGNDGVKAVAISIDDFYLTRAQQIKLANENPGNPFLQQRGYPGTHDLNLGVSTIDALLKLKAKAKIQVPRYDKSANAGAGERVPQDLWPQVEGPIDLILFEGWMLAFDIQTYYNWWKYLDGLIYLTATDYKFVLDWRVEAEQKMRASGRSGMSDQEVTAYARKFLPAYEQWSNSVDSTVRKINLSDKSYLKIKIGKNRLPIASED